MENLCECRDSSVDNKNEEIEKRDCSTEAISWKNWFWDLLLMKILMLKSRKVDSSMVTQTSSFFFKFILAKLYPE